MIQRNLLFYPTIGPSWSFVKYYCCADSTENLNPRKSDGLFKSITQPICEVMSERPILLAILVFGSSVFVTVQLSLAVEATQWIMDLFLLLCWGVLLFRLGVTDTYLKTRIKDYYRQARIHKNQAEQRRIKHINADLGFDESADRRLINLIRWMPDLFMSLTLVLFLMGVLVWVVEQQLNLNFIVFPWCVLGLGIAYMIFNDVWIAYKLKAFIGELPSVKQQQALNPIDMAFHRHHFLARLTKQQKKIFTLHYEQQLTHKQMSALLFISTMTTRTHVNDLLKIWKNYKNEHDIPTLDIGNIANDF